MRRQAVSNTSDPGSAPLSRREFGKRVALVSGAGVAASAGVSGIIVDAHADRHAHGAPLHQDDPSLDKLSADGRARFESMWQNVLRKHGDRLTDEQKTRMRKIIVNNVTMLDSVYAVPIKNGDTPATTLLLVEGQAAPRTVRPSSKRPAAAKDAKRKPAGTKR
jgi:hypothetical protein